MSDQSTSSPDVVARFYVDEITRRAYNPDHVVVKLKAAGRGEQNKTWAQYTPSGTMELTVNNPPAAEFFTRNLGRDIEMRFTALGDERYVTEYAADPVS